MFFVFFFKQKTAYDMRISDWSSDVCSSDLKAAVKSGIAFLPGTATAGDIMRGMDMGLERFKFFPAETSGGIAALKALAAPFHTVRFCPTGGIRAETAAAWLAERSEEHTSELQSLMRISYAGFCFKKNHTRWRMLHNY